MQQNNSRENKTWLKMWWCIIPQIIWKDNYLNKDRTKIENDEIFAENNLSSVKWKSGSSPSNVLRLSIY